MAGLAFCGDVYFVGFGIPARRVDGSCRTMGIRVNVADHEEALGISRNDQRDPRYRCSLDHPFELSVSACAM